MTTPSYTEDLTDIATGDEASGWVELTGTDQDSEAYNANGTPAYEDNEYPYIQGLYAVTQDTTKSTSVGSLAISSGGITIPTDGAILVWQNYSSPFAFGTYAQGGYRICVGSGLADFNVWYVGGNDKGRMPYGGFENHAVNTTVTRDNWAGTTTATLDYVGSAVYIASGPSKGEPHQCDAIRYGRCSAIFEFGDVTNGYATVDGFALQNDNQSNRWGLVQATPGGYLWKGRMQLGSATNAVDFRDSDKFIFIDWTPKVTINFNLIEILNTGSNIEITGFTFVCLDITSASQGRFLMTDKADVAIASCAFIDMDTFIFSDDATNIVTINDSIFRRCNLITAGNAAFDGCTFDNLTGAVGVTTAAPSEAALITNSEFISDGTGNGLEIIGTAANITLSNVDFTGYSLTVDADKAIYVNIATGSMTINISGGVGVSADSHIRTAGCTVTVSADVTVTFTGMKDNTEVRIYATSDGSEIAGIENATAGTTDNRTFAWSAPATTDTYYVIHHWSGTEPFYLTIRKEGYIVPSTDTSVEINQQINRNAE